MHNQTLGMILGIFRVGSVNFKVLKNNFILDLYL